MKADKSKKIEQREDFIKKYRAAVDSGLSKEQLANYMGVKPDSLVRRRLAIEEYVGVGLPYLKSDARPASAEILRKFSAALGKWTKNDKKKDLESSSTDYSQFDRFVITSAQNDTPIHEGFYAALLKYCEVNKAKLFVIPYKYKNATSVYGDSQTFHDKLAPHLLDTRLQLDMNIQILGHITKHPTAIQPLYGLDAATGLDSAIFGHPKIQLKAVPTPSKSLPKILASTGTVTLPNYTFSGAGWRGHDHHSFGAVVLELDREEKIFHLRHVHGDKVSGAFYDLDKYYTPVSVENYEGATALVTGDSHALFMDPQVEKATYTASDSIVNVLKPKNLILHDVLDGYSISHHHRNNDIIKIGKHRFKCGNIEDELQVTADFIDRISKDGMQTYIVKSNHDEHFDRWLQECDYKNDPENAQFFHWMKYNQGKYIQKTNTGFRTIDPFEFWCSNPDRQRGLQKQHLVKILKRDEHLYINNIEFSFHGDRGSSGSRGSLAGFAKIGPKVVIGHSHTPGIYESVYQVGLSAYINLEYKSGCDSWLHTHCLVYPDGRRTLLNVINGRWRR